MTRAGEKFHQAEAEPRGSLLWALVTHPMFIRGAWDMVRLLAVGALVAILFGLG